jgi:parallel beta-helix repeat protein
MRFWTGLCVLLMLPVLVMATIIEVPNDFTTIQEAIDSSSDGDTVLVATGTYYGGIDFGGHQITLASNYILTGDEQAIDETILDGEGTQIVITIMSPQSTGSSVIGFTIQNGYGEGDWPDVHGGGMDVAVSSVTVSHCYFDSCLSTGISSRGGGIYIGGEDGHIEYCTFSNCEANDGGAMALRNGTSGLLVEYCDMYGNVSTIGFIESGAILIPYSSDITLYRCTIHHNESSGVRLYATPGCEIDHCTITDNWYYGVSVNSSGDELTVTNSILIGADGYIGLLRNDGFATIACTYSDISDGEGNVWYLEGCFDLDPMFVDADNHDYNLDEGSPCIDTGDPDGEWDTDNTPPDVGAWSTAPTAGVADEQPLRPIEFAFLHVYPNPFNGSATVSVSLPTAGELTVGVYNTVGQRVMILHEGIQPAGTHSFSINASPLASGQYFVQAAVPGEMNKVQKVMLIR